MFCNYCGTPNPEVASFCRQCGKPIASRTPVSAPPPQPAAAASVEAAPEPAPVQTAPGVPASTPVQEPASPQPYAREPRAASPPRRSSTPGALTASIALLLVGAFIFMRARAERPRILKGHTNYISTVAFSPDGRIVASGSSDGTVKLWDAASGKWLRTLSSYDRTDWIAFSADGRLLAASGGFSSKGLDVWDVSSGNRVRTLAPDAGVGAPAFSPDGRLLAANVGALGDAPAALHLWDAATDADIKSFPGYGSLSVFSPDSRTLAALSPNNAIVLLDVNSGAEVRTFSHSSAITFQALAFSPDGRLIATVDFSSPAINLWDAATGNQLRTITDTAAVRGIAFSPDSRQLASGSEDHTIKLWDVASGARLRTLSGNSDSVNTVAFSPDGRQLASGGADATVRLWPLPAAK